MSQQQAKYVCGAPVAGSAREGSWYARAQFASATARAPERREPALSAGNVKRSVATSLFVCLSVAIIACSSSGASPTSGGGSVEAACAAYRQASDARDARCRSGSVDEDPAFDQFCARLVAAPGSGLSPASFKSCTDRLATLPCDQTPRDVAECDFDNAKGSLVDGAACASDIQCASGECGGGKVDSDDLRCGTCAPRAAVGAACGSKLPSCAIGTICNYPSGSQSGTCKAVAAEGQTCNDVSGPSCGTQLQCDNATKKCIPYPKAGAPCDFLCAGSLRCIAKTCQLAAAAGAACPTGGECGSGLSCNTATKVCGPVPRVPLGGACGSGQIGSCERTADCSKNVCTARIAQGAACDPEGTECVAYSTCLNGVCSPVDPAACK